MSLPAFRSSPKLREFRSAQPPLVSRIQGGLDAIQTKAKALPSPRVLVIADRRQGMLTDLIAIGPDNYVNQILEIAGGDQCAGKARPAAVSADLAGDGIARESRCHHRSERHPGIGGRAPGGAGSDARAVGAEWRNLRRCAMDTCMWGRRTRCSFPARARWRRLSDCSITCTVAGIKVERLAGDRGRRLLLRGPLRVALRHVPRRRKASFSRCWG